MCRPDHFDVTYSINPFMDTSVPVDRQLANQQWAGLLRTLMGLGHRVDVLDPLVGQPDMVFMANAAVLVGNKGMSARFRHPYRNRETAAYHEWLAEWGFEMSAPMYVSEGEGDFVVQPNGDSRITTIYGGLGVRTELDAHRELERILDVKVVTLRLVDERFYHLDTALCFLDSTTALIVRDAFHRSAIQELLVRGIELVDVPLREGLLLGANAVSDGVNVLLAAEADSVIASVDQLGFRPIALEMSEFRKSGGAVRCCVLESY